MILALVGCADPELAVTVALRPGIHDLVATATVAPEGWAWERDGAPTDFTTGRIPAAEVAPGQTWTVTASTPRASATATVEIPEPPGGNVLVVVLDDVGTEKLGLYGGADPPPTPTIDRLAQRGVLFRNAYASPTCTPTRAELLTGRHASRHGAGSIIDILDDTFELPLEALTLPEALALAPGPRWDHSAVGKWHLSAAGSPSGIDHARQQGFAWFAGSLGYLFAGVGSDEIDGYFRWSKITNGELSVSDVYNTTDIVDDALARVAAMPEPFLLWVAFNAPHVPLHVPPAALVTQEVDGESTAAELHAAMLEAVDTELGRLLAGIDPAVLEDTTVIVVGDNGSSDLTVTPPLEVSHAKGTVYEGGVHVPLIVAGPHAGEPGISDALVHAVDVFTTVAEIAGIPLTDEGTGLAVVLGDETRRIDGQSLLPWLADPSAPGPETVFAEAVGPNGPPPWSSQARMVRDQRWKLLRIGEDEQLFELVPGAFVDGPNLLDGDLDAEQTAAWLRLTLELDTRIAQLPYEGF